MSRKVTYARLHQTAYIPGAGEVGNVFPPQSKTLENLEMTSTIEGLTVTFQYRGARIEALIPSANVIIMTLAPEPKSEVLNVTLKDGKGAWSKTG